MSELHVSPLLDAMEVGECFASHGGVSCYSIVHPESGREFVLKRISVPASQDQVQALLLTGAYNDDAEAEEYYRKEAEALVKEAEERKKLLDCPYILPFLGVQMEKKEGQVGYDVYAVLPRRNSLQEYLNGNAVSHLRGINMGIDLCVALSALREEGYVHGNLKPGNVFFSDTGRFLLGDFGLISTEDMQYSVLPEQYRSGYTAPELRNYIGGLNTTVDIYSLGMILYRIYNGNHAPFEDEQTNAKAADTRRLEGEALPAPLYADYELTEIIQKACAYEPKDRYQTPDEMRLELENYMRRNAVSDHLIVPPIVSDDAPLAPEQAEEQAQPVSFTDVDKLDDTFKSAFTPKQKKAKKEKKAKKKTEKKDDSAAPAQEAAASPEASRQAEQTPLLDAERKKAADKQKRRRSRKKKAWAAFAILMALLVIGIGVYEFTALGNGGYHFFVQIKQLEISETTADSMKVSISTNVRPETLTAVCQDAYGNSFPGSFQDGMLLFTGLKPGTRYTVKLDSPGLHKLSGTTSVSGATAPLTDIVTFEAADGQAAGNVTLTIRAADESTEPQEWSVDCIGAGSHKTLVFSGHSYTVTELQPGTEYTFRILPGDGLYLTGNTEITCTPIPEVLAEGFVVDGVLDREAYVSWICTSELPETWTLTCTGDEGEPTVLELPAAEHAEMDENSYSCSARVPGIEPGGHYLLELTAPGLFTPLQIDFTDTTAVLEGLTAQAQEDGIHLSWTSSRQPEGGWEIYASTGDGEPVLAASIAEGTEAVVCVAPKVSYTFTIAAADGTSVTGSTSVTAESLPEAWFNALGVNSSRSHYGLWDAPDKPVEEWTKQDLGAGNLRPHVGDQLAVSVEANGTPASSDETVSVLYVVYDSRGTIVSEDRDSLIWNEMWQGRDWYSLMPSLPDTPGSYRLEIFINSRRLARINFTVRR